MVAAVPETVVSARSDQGPKLRHRHTDTYRCVRMPALQGWLRGNRLAGYRFRLGIRILKLLFLSGRRSDVRRHSRRLTDGCEEIKLGQMCRGMRVNGGDLLRYEGMFTAGRRTKVWWWRGRKSLCSGIVAGSGGGSRTQVWGRRGG